jgi:hypothetical protein
MGCGHRSAQLCVHEIPKTSENVTAQIERSTLTFVPVQRALILIEHGQQDGGFF